MGQGFRVGLLSSERCGSDILTCRFARPEAYDFTPGQHAMLTLATSEGLQAKPFSLAAAPHDDYVEFTTRLSDSAFKRSLSALEVGDEATISAARGRFVLPEGVRSAIFLAGGIGITPMRSILRDAVQRKTGMNAVLFFGNRDETCIPYREEFDAMEPQGVKVVHVLERPQEDWPGPRGYITSDLVREIVDPAKWELFVVAGPPVMVEVMQRILDELEVDPGRLMVERFSGYA